MNPPLLSRRLTWIVAGLVTAAALGLAAHWWLRDYVLRAVLHSVGAEAIHYRALRGSPWHAEIDDLSFQVRAQSFAARRIVIDRTHWWSASLGRVKIEGAEIPVYLDGSDVDPWNWKLYGNGAEPDRAMNLPVETVDLDGQLLVRLANVPEKPIHVRLEGRPRSGTSWLGSLVAEGEGFRLAGNGSLLRAGQELDFQVLSAELDVGVWTSQIHRLVSLPGAPWQLAGKLTGVAEGRVTARRFAATGRVSLHDGRIAVPSRFVRAEGAEATLEFSDLWKFRTQSAELHIGRLSVGRVVVEDVEARGGMTGPRTVVFDGLHGRAFDGELGTGAFRCYLDQPGLEIGLQATNLDAAQVAALLSTPLAVRGRLDANFPVLITSTGVRIGTGWAAMRADSPAAVRMNPAALLRAGVTVDDGSLKVLKAAGSEPVMARVDELRIDLRPPDLPLGNSVRLRLAGGLPSGDFSASLNVPGAIEGYLEVKPTRD